MAQSMSTDPQGIVTNKGDSPAGRVMNEAIELDIEGRSPYPKRASFIDADAPYVGKAIRRAVEGGYAVVLVAADGSTCTLRADPARSPRRRRLSEALRGVLPARAARPRALPR
jgi:hypothetical protein